MSGKAGAGKGGALVLLGLMLGILLAALDQTVVGTSLGKIVADLGGFERFSWLFAAYMLASTAVIPLAGKLSDRIGRRPVYLGGMAVFLVGSVLCGTATSMSQLIAYRVLQGLGGGVLFPVALATVADLYAPRERAKVQGAFGATFGLSSVLGPFLGGWIVDNVHLFGVDSWRWVFYVNVPVGAAAIAIVALHFPRIAPARDPARAAPFDLAGLAALTVALVAGLLVTVWGGDMYAWSSVEILATTAVALAALAAFIFVERRARDPVVPLVLFREPVFLVSFVATAFLGVGMFAVISFMPTYMQGVVGISATNSGAVLTPLMLAIVAGAVASGRLTNRLGYKAFALVGSLLVAVGYVLLTTLGERPSVATATGYMVVLGVGLGFTIQTYLVAVQNVVERRLVGVATSTLTLARSVGGTVGITALGVLLNRGLEDELPRRLGPALGALLSDPASAPFLQGKVARVPSLLLQPGFTTSAPAAVVEAIKGGFTASIGAVFLAGAAIGAAALLATVFLRAHPLKSAEEYHAAVLPRCGACGRDLGAKVRYARGAEARCGGCFFTLVPPEERPTWRRVDGAGASSPPAAPPPACATCARPLAHKVHWRGPDGRRACGECYFGRIPAAQRGAFRRETPG